VPPLELGSGRCADEAVRPRRETKPGVGAFPQTAIDSNQRYRVKIGQYDRKFGNRVTKIKPPNVFWKGRANSGLY